MSGKIHVIGASGRSGAALCRALAQGRGYVPVVRDPAAWLGTGLAGEPNMADLRDARALQVALAGAEIVVSCAHARHTPAVLAAAPPGARLVLIGSTRRFSRLPDDGHGAGVLAGEAAFLASGRDGVMLHPTMIYGAQGEDNVQRLAALMRRLPFLPLPGGGANLVQPIHQDDLTACLLAAIEHPWQGPRTLVVAGPEPVHYADFARAIAQAAGLEAPRILSLPVWLLLHADWITRLPGLPRIRAEEVRRLVEDKAFPIDEMRALLGVAPMPLAEGLARSFA